MPAFNRTNLKASALAKIPSGTPGAVTALKIREVLTDVIDSATNPLDDGALATAAALASGLAGKSDTGHTHGAATTSTPGFMSAADKTKLDGISGSGTPGADGDDGWAPILSVVTDGARRVLQIVDWTGGTGTKPSVVNQFIGASGIVSTAAAAVDIRGAAGPAGSGAGDMLKSENLSGLPDYAAARTALGLGNVNNTSDAAKPISTATQTALDLKAPLASPAFTGTPTGITKAHVGLSNVDNTADASKPVSTAQAAADTAVQNFAVARANHTGTQLASTISDFIASARAQIEAALIAGTNVTITPAGSGATRTFTIAASGGGGGGGDMLAANNLSELTSPATARTNLGLGTSATTDAVAAVASTTGAPDAGKLPLLNSAGVLDASFLVNAPSGGGGGDLLSTLTAAEISITGATTATLGRMHVVSGTSTDYTITLPAASGNAGKWVGFRMASTLTKFVTINGELFWKGETVTYLSNGSTWVRFGGSSIGMSATLSYDYNSFGTPGGGQSISSATVTKINFNGEVNPTGAMTNVSNHTITILRGGRYSVTLCVAFDAVSPFAATRVFSRIRNAANTELAGAETGVSSGTYPTFYLPRVLTLAAGDVIHGACFQNSGASRPLYGNGITYLSVEELR
jgi:hypothetical protein